MTSSEIGHLKSDGQSVAPPSGTQAGVPGAARRVSYGCTDVVSATDFLKQLGELAAKGGAA